jgi:DNA-binding beta-propeller fold protein YncE
MNGSSRVSFALAALMLVASVASAAPPGAPRLVLRATYDTGLGANGAEIISIRHTDAVAVLTNVAGSIDVLDLSNPLQPRQLYRLPVDTAAGTPNSAAVHPHHDYFLVVTGRAGVTGRVAAYRLSDGTFLASAPVGIEPDSIAIAPNGQYAVVANEAEGVGIGQNGGPGSISIIDLRGFNGVRPAELSVETIVLPSQAGNPGFSTGRTDDIARLPIDNTPNTLEPESVAFSQNSRFAYVTLQENNGVVRVEVGTAQLTFLGLGQTMHAADLTVDGVYRPFEILTAFREPDGITLDRTGRYFVTADEGDTRNAAGNADPRGGRTVSVFDAETGALLGDTGSQIDDAAAAAGVYPDSRSNRGSSEPEGLDLTNYRDRTLVAVGLERANAVELIDVTDPTDPVVLDIASVGVGPEGVKFFRVGSRLFVAAANEVSGTVSLLEVVQ